MRLAKALPRTVAALACSVLAAVLLAACGTTASTSNFKGEEHAVAQTVANLQSDVTAGEDKKICTNDLAAEVVSRLGGQRACEAAVKRQREEVDNPQVEVKSVSISGTHATAQVSSTVSGKTKTKQVTLVHEGGGWRISALQ